MRAPGAAEPQRHSQPALDTLRAVAVLAVMTTHVAFQTGMTVSSSWGPLLARLDVGVAVFFVLSGYLLGRPFVAPRADGGGPAIRPYAWRRFLRIVPAYVVVVLVAMLALADNRGAGWADLLRHLTFTQVASPGHLLHGLTQTWSLCTEVAFYLLLPLIAVPLRRATGRGRSSRALAWCAGLVVANLVFLVGVGSLGWFDRRVTGFWLPSFATWFAVGLALAIVAEAKDRVGHQVRAALVTAGHAPLACWTSAVALLLIASTPVAGPLAFEGQATTGQAVAKNLLYAGVALLLVLPVAYGEPTSTFVRVLSSRALVFVGLVSYAMFLWHLIVLEWTLRLTGIAIFSGSFALVWVGTFLGTVAVSTLSYYLVERPSQRLRGLVPRRSTADSPAVHAAAEPSAAITSS